jgi:hypothetical protein
LKQQLAKCRDNKQNFPSVPIDGTIVSLQGIMLDNKYLYEKCREDGLATDSLVQLKINHPSNNGKYYSLRVMVLSKASGTTLPLHFPHRLLSSGISSTN